MSLLSQGNPAVYCAELIFRTLNLRVTKGSSFNNSSYTSLLYHRKLMRHLEVDPLEVIKPMLSLLGYSLVYYGSTLGRLVEKTLLGRVLKNKADYNCIEPIP